MPKDLHHQFQTDVTFMKLISPSFKYKYISLERLYKISIEKDLTRIILPNTRDCF